MTEGLTKKQFKELRKLERMQSQNLEKNNSKVKWIAISVVSVLFLFLFVGTILIAKNKNKPTTASGAAQFANNGHIRMLTSKGDDATASAEKAQKAITMVEYGDFECPACKTYHPVVKQVLATFPDQLKLVFKNFPLTTVHPNAQAAAVAAEAAGRQDKFFQFVDVLYDKQDEWAGLDNPQSKFEEYAKDLSLNLATFQKDQKDPVVAKLIEDEKNEGIQNGVTGTPSFYIDGKKIENPATFDAFKKIVGDEIKRITGNNPPQALPTVASGKLPLQQ